MRKILKAIGLIFMCLTLVVVAAAGIRALSQTSQTGSRTTAGKVTKPASGSEQEPGTTPGNGSTEEPGTTPSEPDPENSVQYSHAIVLLYSPTGDSTDDVRYTVGFRSSSSSAVTSLSQIPNATYISSGSYYSIYNGSFRLYRDASFSEYDVISVTIESDRVTEVNGSSQEASTTPGSGSTEESGTTPGNGSTEEPGTTPSEPDPGNPTLYIHSVRLVYSPTDYDISYYTIEFSSSSSSPVTSLSEIPDGVYLCEGNYYKIEDGVFYLDASGGNGSEYVPYGVGYVTVDFDQVHS